MKPLFIAVITLVLGGALAMPALAASDQTVTFIQKAGVGNMFELKTSQLALQRTRNDDVRAFANEMIKDHGQVGVEMGKVLSAANKQFLPENLDRNHQTVLDKLEKTPDEDFDRDYINAQVKAHDEAVTLFKQYASKGGNRRLKSFTSQNLPTLQGHQQHVKNLKSKFDTMGTR